MNRWQLAADAAWRTFGHRYWKLFVGVHLARKAAPWVLIATALGLLAWAGYEGTRHAGAMMAGLPHPSWWWLAPVAAAGVVALGATAVRRRRYRVPKLRRWPLPAGLTVCGVGLAALAVWFIG